MRSGQALRPVVILGIIVPLISLGQYATDTATYRLRPWVDGPVIAGCGVLTYFGMQRKVAQEPLSEELVLSLNTSHIGGFDRGALQVGLEDRTEALDRSDLVMRAAVVAPLLLGLDRRVREEWKPLMGLYVEAMLANTAVQSWTACSAGRYRPITYIPEATLDQRTDALNHNSFFSGHTSTTATASFFMAKVIDDLHPELGWKRWLVYGAAAVPPALAGYYRVQAAKHFPSDVLTGFAFGAAVGVLVPELHKGPLATHLSCMPWSADGGYGATLALTW